MGFVGLLMWKALKAWRPWSPWRPWRHKQTLALPSVSGLRRPGLAAKRWSVRTWLEWWVEFAWRVSVFTIGPEPKNVWRWKRKHQLSFSFNQFLQRFKSESKLTSFGNRLLVNHSQSLFARLLCWSSFPSASICSMVTSMGTGLPQRCLIHS